MKSLNAVIGTILILYDNTIILAPFPISIYLVFDQGIPLAMVVDGILSAALECSR